MKQVKLTLLFLLTAFVAFGQTVTPDPGPYTPMNQKYQYRWLKTTGGIWNTGKLVQVDSAQFSGITYVPTVANSDSSIKAANTAWVRRLFATGTGGGGGSNGQWDTAGNAGLTDPRLGTTDNVPFALVTNNIKRLVMPAAGILSASSNYVYLVKDTLNGELKYTTSGGGGGSTDTTSLSNRINLKLNIADTAGFTKNTATQTLTNKTLTTPVINVGSDATGDMYYRNSGGAFTRLPIGTSAQRLAVVGGVPVWRDTAAAGGASGWGLTGNAITAGTDFLGSTNNVSLRLRTNNVERFVIDSTGNKFTFGVDGGSPVGTTTPLVVSFGNTYGTNTPGNEGNLKWYMYNPGATGRYGIGMSTNNMEYQVPSSAVHSWFVNSQRVFTANSTGIIMNNIDNIINRLSAGQALGNAIMYIREGEFGFGVQSGQFRMFIPSSSNRFSFLNAINGTEVFSITGGGRIGIGNSTPNASSSLDIVSTTTGFLPPRQTTTERNAIATPATGLSVYNTTLSTNDVKTAAAWYQQPNGLTGSGTLDFPSTGAHSSEDLTITVTGAADGDMVILGVPNASVTNDSNYSAWVSAANTVTVRYNHYGSGTSNPASGIFKVYVIKN